MQSPYRSMRVQVIIGRPERFGLCRSRPYRRTKEKWNIRHLLTGSFDGDHHYYIWEMRQHRAAFNLRHKLRSVNIL